MSALGSGVQPDYLRATCGETGVNPDDIDENSPLLSQSRLWVHVANAWAVVWIVAAAIMIALLLWALIWALTDRAVKPSWQSRCNGRESNVISVPWSSWSESGPSTAGL